MKYRPREQALVSNIMRRVRSVDTTPELSLRKALWRQGLRYRIHVKWLPGSPDIVFTRKRVAVFVDGDFWHGRQWRSRGLATLQSQFAEAKGEYWVPKITRNIQRDERVNQQLEKAGWRVVRIWESEINANLEDCADRVIKATHQGKRALESARRR